MTDADAPTSPRLTLAQAGMIGLPALLAALAAGHLVAAFVGSAASPYLAVGNSVIDMSPAWLVEFAKNAFGTANKVVLFGGIALVLVAVAVFAGWLSRRRLLPGLILVCVLGVVGIVAVATRPNLGGLAVVAPVVSLLVGGAAFAWLHGRAHGNAELAAGNAELAPSPTVTRRRLLVSSAGVLAGAGVAGAAGQWLAGPDVEASRRAVADGLNGAGGVGSRYDFASAGTPTMITSNEDFYTIHTAFTPPKVLAEQWRLRIHGMVERPLTLTYAELRERPLVDRTLTLACVSNPVGGDLISTARFTGVDLAELLAEAGVKQGAEQLFSTSDDGWTAGTPIEAVQEEGRDAMLAVGMNGEPLPVEHGFPVRMIVPGLYGFVSATKWLVDLEVTTWDARTPYWVPRGWSRFGPVKTQSRIDRAAADGGSLTVAGTAWALPHGIERVEVQVDNGSWHEAELADELDVKTWRMWRAVVDVAPGDHTVRCRATDKTGYTQTADEVPVAPDGATGWHSVDVSAS